MTPWVKILIGLSIGLLLGIVLNHWHYSLPILSSMGKVFIAPVCAIGAAGILGTGLVMLSGVLNAVGLPLEGIVLVTGVDRLRERIATAVNVMGDAVAAVYIARKEKQICLETYHHATWLG